MVTAPVAACPTARPDKPFGRASFRRALAEAGVVE